ncbi:DNA repair protein [Sarcoptes scabiei]|nr:DNA repair protein [Sarcoptes scabiei]
MNAYQIPLTAGTSPSPFNYFPPNSHSYGVISSSYGNPRAANLNPKTMTSPSDYFHHHHPPPPSSTHHHHAAHPNHSQSPHHSHPHLQSFTGFSTNSSIQSPNSTSPYNSSHYGAYVGGTNASTTSSSPHGFDYGGNSSLNVGVGNAGYSASNSTPTSCSSYNPYLSSCSNGYSYASNPLSAVNSIPTSLHQPPHSTSSSLSSSSSTSSSVSAALHPPSLSSLNQSTSNQLSTNPSSITINPESYLNMCNNNNSNEDLYSLYKNENQLPPIKRPKRSGRGRARRTTNPSPSPENHVERIFIWYLDETILSYLSIAEYNRYSGFNSSSLNTTLYNDLYVFINKLAEKYLFLSDLKDIDQSHIEDSAADDNGQDLSDYNFASDGFTTSVSCCLGSSLNNADLRQKMALRYRKINETYSNYCDKLDELLDKSDYDQLQDLLKRFDLYSKDWIQPALKALSFIKTRTDCLNVIISSSPLIFTLSKILMFNLGPYFSISNVYSCSKTSKEHTLNRILNRFGTACTYIVIGKGLEEQQLSQKVKNFHYR